MADHSIVPLDAAGKHVIDALASFPAITSMRALERAETLLNAAQQAREQGKDLGLFVPDPNVADLPGLAEAIGALLEMTRQGDEPEFLEGAGLARTCLRHLLAETAAEGQRTQ